jgi:hypothetical protein
MVVRQIKNQDVINSSWEGCLPVRSSSPSPFFLQASYPVVGYFELHGQVRMTGSSYFDIQNHLNDNNTLLVGSARGNQGTAGCFLLSAE